MPETWQGDWNSENPYPAAAQTELTIGLMDELGMDEAVLVGDSTSDTVAMLTALEHQNGSKRWCSSIPRCMPAETRCGIACCIQRTADAPPWPADRTADSGLGPDFARSAWHDPSQITDDVWAGYLKPLVANWDRALWELTASNEPSGLPDRLDELTLPVLVITGDDDRIVPTEQSVRLADEAANAQLVVVPACGHVPHEECPQAVMDAITAFLAKVP